MELDLKGQTELSTRGGTNIWRNKQNSSTHLESGNDQTFGVLLSPRGRSWTSLLKEVN